MMELTPEEQYTAKAPVFKLNETTFIITGTIALGKHQCLYIDGVEIFPDESQKIRNHSPDGFAWGYAGSGPAQSALAICLHIFRNKHVAESLYQSFKVTHVAHWQHAEPFRKEVDIADFLINHQKELKIASDWEKRDKERQQFVNVDEAETDAEDQVENPRMIETVNHFKADPPHPLRFWHVGDLVTITHPAYKGVKALVYEVYDRPENSYGISLIAQDGRNLGGWEPDSWKFMDYSHDTGLDYNFVSLSQLDKDYQSGLLVPYFEIL